MVLGMLRKKCAEGELGAFSTAEEVTAGVDGTGLRAIVTGGTSGIGLETVRVLALRGVEVFLAARNVDKATKVRADILEKQPDAKIELLKMDVSSTASVRQAAKEFLALNLPLNILVNNAGIFTFRFELSADNLESQFATNYVGTYLLTELLLEKMKATAKESDIEGRIVNVSSMVHKDSYRGGINFDTITSKKGFSGVTSYGQSKLAMILHAKELATRLKNEGANVTVNALHPGIIRTDLVKGHGVIVSVYCKVMDALWGKDLSQGAATQCYVALNPKVKGLSGEYFDDCKVSQPAPVGQDLQLAKRLWDYTSELLKKAPLPSQL